MHIKKLKTVSYRWFCIDKDRCQVIDEQIDALTLYQAHLSAAVNEKIITGIQCLDMEPKLVRHIKELREERKTLWRRVRREVEEEIVSDTPKAEPEKLPVYESPFAKPNMERVL